MKKVLKIVLQYIIPPALAIALLVYQYRNTDLNEIWVEFRRADIKWILISLIPWHAAHLFRALRWNQLLVSSGFTPRLFTSYTAIVASYFANLILPRLGEISRCALIKKSDNVEMDTAVGTVVVDRMLDLVTLLIVTILGLFITSEVLIGFLKPMLMDKLGKGNMIFVYLGIVALLGLGLLLLAYRYRQTLRANPLGAKVSNLIDGVIKGILSIRRVKKPGLFLFYSLMIWACYFFSTYSLMNALPISNHFGLDVGFAVLILGSFGMAAPVQGGIGPYHFMVGGGLMFFGMQENMANITAGFLHTIPTFYMVVFGGASFLVSLYAGKKRAIRNSEE